jgi:CheY-like chemotaxis protein
MRTAMPSLEASLEAMESEMSCEPLPESGNTATPHGATRILLADGSRADLDDACSALQALGHAFDAVGSAQEAFARHAEHPYDLILLEAGIAAANDFAALPRLRSLSADRVPLIACVSDISEARRDAFLRADMDDICAKPLVKSQLSRCSAFGCRPRTGATARKPALAPTCFPWPPSSATASTASSRCSIAMATSAFRRCGGAWMAGTGPPWPGSRMRSAAVAHR